MAFKIFVLGATGYITGDALYALAKKHPEFEYAALVRSEAGAKRVSEAFPEVRVVIGSLDDAEIIKREVAWADLVLEGANADHEPALNAIISGLTDGGHNSASQPKYWLHLGGTGILTYYEEHELEFGQPPAREYDDVDGLDVIEGIPAAAFHAVSDGIVRDAGRRYGDVLKTAIVSPSVIYGIGRGPVNTRSMQCPALAGVILKRGHAPICGTGEATTNNVHVGDLSEAFILLVEAAVAGNTSPDIWGPEGYHVVGADAHQWGPLARKMTEQARDLGLIKTEGNGIKEFQMSKQEALDVADWDGLSWGLNSVCKARRLREYLGWKPRYPGIEDAMVDTLKEEARRLGIA